MANKRIYFQQILSSMVLDNEVIKVDKLTEKVLDFDNLYHN